MHGLLLLLLLHLLKPVLLGDLLQLLATDCFWVRLHIYATQLIWMKLYLLTGITSAAKVLPLTTRRSYMMFWGAILLKANGR
jgi:hypothetical protein